MNRKQRRATLKHGPPDRAPQSPFVGESNQPSVSRSAGARTAPRKLDDAARTLQARVVAQSRSRRGLQQSRARVSGAGQDEGRFGFLRARARADAATLRAICRNLCNAPSLLPPLGEALRRQVGGLAETRSTRGRTARRCRTCRNRGRSAAALSSAIDAGSRCRVRAPADCAARFPADRTAGSRSPTADHRLRPARSRRQCFINEYVFATTPEEDVQVDDLERDASALASALQSIRCSLPRSRCMCRCTHLPMRISAARTHMDSAIDEVLTPASARAMRRSAQLRDSIPRLTPIEDEVSQRVRQQYEENPYPRWVHAAGQVAPIPIDQYLREQFPTSAFTPLGKTESARHAHRRLRDRPDRDRIGAKISGRAGARDRPQSEQSVLRQTQDACRPRSAYRLRASRHS